MSRRIALVLATSTGGVGRHVQALARGLLQCGERVAVLGPAATDELFGFSALGARFAAVPIASGPRPVADARASARLRRLVRGADVVHAHGLRAGLVSSLATAGRPVPLVVTWHNRVLATGRRGSVLRPMELLVARAADVTLGASADLVDRVRDLGGRDVRLGPIGAPALDPPERSRAEIRAQLCAGERPLVLAVGRLHPQKGYDTLIAAAARWRARQPVPLVAIAGSGPLQRELAEQIARLDAPVRLLGHRTDVANLLAAADIVVLPSRWEARSLVAQEVLRAGTPLVATAVGGLPELLEDGARLIPPGDVAALDAAVAALLDDPGLARSLAERGREVAARWPTEQDTLLAVRQVYDELT